MDQHTFRHFYPVDGLLRIEMISKCVNGGIHLFSYANYQNGVPVRVSTCTMCMGPSAGLHVGEDVTGHVPWGIRDYHSDLININKPLVPTFSKAEGPKCGKCGNTDKLLRSYVHLKVEGDPVLTIQCMECLNRWTPD